MGGLGSRLGFGGFLGLNWFWVINSLGFRIKGLKGFRGKMCKICIVQGLIWKFSNLLSRVYFEHCEIVEGPKLPKLQTMLQGLFLTNSES